MEAIEKRYDPSIVENKIYKFWEDGEYFKAVPDSSKEPYTIVIPPPNVTGKLHMGHALDETLQDILIRFKRMQGFCTLWLPGTDHAGIATQIKVEAELRKTTGQTKYDLGRERFLERVWDWKNMYGSSILNQLKRLGSSCDWSRERFTMDEEYSGAVRRVFVNLYNKGIIYKGTRMINWCPSCRTALSDTEVEHEDQDSYLWHIRYPVVGSDSFVTIATTRPETMLGDSGVAVNPSDERFKDIIGKNLMLPLCNREIPLIADEYVDPSFGTGAVKMTPAHDPNDFEIGKRHNLEEICVIDEKGFMNDLCGKYAGLSGIEARKQVVADLENEGYLVKKEPYSHSVGVCHRCSATVEPSISAQWFVKMSELAEPAVDVVKNKEIEFIPERFAKIYIHWMENVYDWCISRQLWWGHRIPAFYCESCGKTTVSEDDITTCPDCGGSVTQDEDVLDTWFSSALWPFATLGFPENTEDLKYFYPTSTLVTGYDIIFFWIARMIFSGLEHMGQKPFNKVFIHGLVRDSQGRKMSKSLGNGIDPLEIIDQYGADALRMTLASGNSPGNDMRFYTERVESNRNFANKLWNAARFVLMNLNDELPPVDSPTKNLELEDKWILSLYNILVREVTENLENFELGMAIQKIYDFIWDEFCDWYIEMVKPRLFAKEDIAAQQVLVYVLANVLKLLHPFMPFITEEIYGYLPVSQKPIINVKFPEYSETVCYENEQHQVETIKELIRKVRNVRAEKNVAPSKKAHLIIITKDVALFEDKAPLIERLASASEITAAENRDMIPENAVSIVTENAEVFMPISDIIDNEQELKRLTDERTKITNELELAKKKLNNEGFVSKAPPALIEQEHEKVQKYTDMLEKIESQISQIGEIS